MTPLVLLVGFLGAGKTTLLRSLIPELRRAGLDPSLILNDYQNARVDAELFREVASDIRPISGSCVCCGSRDELIGQLENFSHRPNSIMLIEANGTTDTPELVEYLTAHPKLMGYTLPMQIAVVDAKRWQKRFWHNELERVQVRTATQLFLSRRDEVPSARLEKVERDLAGLAPNAEKLERTEFVKSLTNLEVEVRGEVRRQWSLSPAASVGPLRALSNARHSHVHSHFASAEFILPEVVDREELVAFLNSLPDAVIRAKGIVRFENEGPFWIFQKVEQSQKAQFIELQNPSAGTIPLLIVVGPQLRLAVLESMVTKFDGRSKIKGD